jgi:hypothetical protein
MNDRPDYYYYVSQKMTNPQHSATKCEHYTPEPIIRLARELMGDIFLDPASDHIANEIVQASCIMTKEDDGFKHSWIGTTVFCNPPGRTKDTPRSQPGITEWFLKMYEEHHKGNFVEGIFIGYTLELLAKVGDIILKYPICIPQPHRLGVTTGMGRIKFDAVTDSGGRESQKQPTHGNIIVYFPPKTLGFPCQDKIQMFHDIFSKLGACK